MPFSIYQASAGSGKTYVLVKEYLILTLKDPKSFKNVLAITFTNKAAKEMKTRILTALKELSNNKNLLLKEDLQKDLIDVDIKKNASILLTKILHNYSNFAVTTIDSFIYKIVKSFAFELNLPPYFELDLKEEQLSERIKDKLIDSIGENKEITKIFDEFIDFIALDEENNIKSKLDALTSNISKQLFNETSPIYDENFEKIDLRNYQKVIKEQSLILKTIDNKTKDALNILNGLDEETSSKISNFKNLIKKLNSFRNRIFTPKNKLITKQLENEIFFKKANNNLENDLKELGFHKNIQELKVLYYENIEILTSNKIFLKHVFDMILIKKMKELLEDYITENDIVPISEINRRVSEIIKKDSTPFIYYKIGEYYQNYLIDEFQDTSLKQWNNLYPLIENSQGEGHFGMAVGDPKQAIYRWRGGDVNIMNYEIEKKLNDVKKINLKYNYRSSKTIIDFNNSFFKNLLKKTDNDYLTKIYQNVEQISKKHDNGFVSVNIFNLPNKKEATEVITKKLIEKIEDLITEEIYELKDIAILVNTNKEGELIANALFEKEIEVSSSESLLIANEPIVLLLINAINWLISPENILLSTKIAYFLNLINDKNNRMLFRKLEKKQFLENKEIDVLKIQGINTELKELSSKREQLLTYSLYDIIESLIKIFNLDQNHSKTGRFLERFLGLIKESDKDNIYSFLEWWEENKSNLSLISQEDYNAIKIITIHKAKGLEFPVVFIPFANWDYRLSNKHDIWLKNKDGLSHLVTPNQELENSVFKKNYEFEKKMYFMDSINKLYVSFTRAISSLFIFAYYNKKNNIANLIHKTLFENQDSNGELIYIKGKLPKKFNSKIKTENYLPIKNFLISDWKSKLTVISQKEINKEIYTQKLSESINIDGEHFEFIKDVIRDIDKLNLENKNKIIVLPNKKTARYFNAIYKKINNNDIFTTSFDDFVTNKIKYKKGYQKAEFMDILFALIEIMPNKIEDNFNSFFNLSKNIINDFNELDANLVAPEDFFNYLTNLNEIDERFIDLKDEIKYKHIESMKDLYSIYKNLNKKLLENKKLYTGKIYQYFYNEMSKYINEKDYFIFAGFNKFTKSEIYIIKKLINENKAKIYFDTDDYYLKNLEHEAGNLLRKHIKELDLKRINWTQNKMKAQKVNISINATSTKIAEIKALANKLKDLIIDNKVRGNNTAIILENKEYLTPLLTSLPKEIKELNISINYPLKETLIYRLIKTIILLHENNYKNNKYIYKKDILNLLIHPYFKIIASEYSQNTTFLISEIENYGKNFIPKRKIKELLNNSLYSNIIENWKTKTNFIQTINFVNDTLTTVVLNDDIFKTRKLETVVLEYFKITTNLINDHLDKLDIKLPPKIVWRLYNDYFSSQRVPFDTPLFNGVQILTLEDTRGLDFENVLFLSVNENIFPHKKELNTSIPLETRLNYNLTTYETQESDTSYLFYRLIQHAKNIEIFYHDNIKDKGEKSRYIEQILLEYTNINKNLNLENNFLTFEAKKNNFKNIKINKNEDIINVLKTYNFSPSMLNTYRTCSLKFYFDYILKLNKYDSPNTINDPRTFGLIFHKTLENLYKNKKIINTKVISNLKNSYKIILDKISKELLEEVDRGAGKLIYNILDKVILQLLEYDEKNPFQILKLEEKLERKFKYKDSIIKLKGSADRIDIINLNKQKVIRIIDYKTGKSSNFKKLKEINNNLDEISFQLLHYAYCYNPNNSFKSSAFFIMDKSKIENSLNIYDNVIINNNIKEHIFKEFESLLKELFKEIFDLGEDFLAIEENLHCRTCIYSDICGKNTKGFNR